MPTNPVKPAGDSALLIEFGEPTIEPASNVRAIATARAIRNRALPGVRDVVSTFRSVAVFFDPLATDIASLEATMVDAAKGSQAEEDRGRTVEIPVVYGGAAGPDIGEVAAYARCATETVVERHSRKSYRVYMHGFLPGFAYMAHVDPTIASPRRATPRLRVPAGSVGIAGAQTGIYPRDSPGGWQIIGRTAMRLFDPRQTPPALLLPGDYVRFVPVKDRPADATRTSRLEADESGANNRSRSVTVLHPGLLTTVQDSGRWGYQSLGVSVSGPMDRTAHRLANVIVGNPPGAAAIEATLVGPELRMEQDTGVAVAGADMRVTVDGADVPLHTPVRCRTGSILCFREPHSGSRAYVAFGGGIATPAVLGSQSTHIISGLGGMGGRALKAGDRIPIGNEKAVGRLGRLPGRTNISVGGARLRVLPGPQSDYFDRSVLDAVQRMRFTISPRSDRMGYRLTGGGAIPGSNRGDMISDVMFMGGVQVPPSGDPILLMADRQTTGGYPQIVIVITADLAKAGQLVPGDWVEFEMCRRSDAIAALIAEERSILAVR